MWRHRTACGHCEAVTAWNRDREAGAEEMRRHLDQAHGIDKPQLEVDYHWTAERQCDYCLEPSIDDCTKCGRDYCRLHCGSVDGIHGYCGCCL